MTESSKSGISIAVPNKGRLSDEAVDLVRRAGIGIDPGMGRALVAQAWDGRVRVLFVRAQDIPELVQDGRADLGITGLDLVLESRAKVKRLQDLRFGRCRLVLAVPEKLGATTLTGLPRPLKVATSFPNLTRAWLRKQSKDAEVIRVSGATEIMPHIGVADAVVDLTATGSTLAMNDLVEVGSLLDSTAWLVATPDLMDGPKKDLAEEVAFALQSVVEARAKRYLMMDVPTDRLEEVRKIVPGIAGPTVMDIYGDARMKAVHVVVDAASVHDVLKRLKRMGARGLLVVPIDRMVA